MPEPILLITDGTAENTLDLLAKGSGLFLGSYETAVAPLEDDAAFKAA
jgi:hypothetical protein